MIQETKKELSEDWVNYVKASLQTRIDYTSESTAKVLEAIQGISSELDNKEGLQALIELKTEESSPHEILLLLKDVLNHLDVHDALTQLIYPLFSVLQFEDRTRQKLESIMGMASTWSQLSGVEEIEESELAEKLMEDVISMEQQIILSKYFPNHISADEADFGGGGGGDDFDDIDFF